MRIRSAKVAALLAALTLSGCSNSSDSENTERPAGTPEPGAQAGAGAPGKVKELDAEPATGATVETDDYSYKIPEGWELVPAADLAELADAEAVELTSAARSSQPRDGFSDNITVVSTRKDSLGQVESKIQADLKTAGAADIATKERVRVGGTTAVHASARMPNKQGAHRLEQYYLSNGEQARAVSISIGETVPEKERAQTAESILATWTWK